MTLRRRFLLYLIVLHVLFAAAAVPFLLDHRWVLVAVEATFAVSFAVAYRLVRALVAPLELLKSSAELLRSSDFTTRFQPFGNPELDQLIAVYNRMADHLRTARIRDQEQQLFLSQVLDASPAGVIVLALDGVVVATNPAANTLLGLTPELTRGQSLAALEVPFATSLDQLPAGEARVLTLGRRRVRCQRSTFVDRGFRREFLILVELTEELRRSERAAYDKLIRMMAHEVNNTTGAIGSLLTSCLNYRRHLPAEERSDFVHALEVAIERGQHMNAFMRRFADVVRLPTPDKAPCNLPTLVADVARLLQGETQALSIRAVTEVEAGDLVIHADRILIEQALLNIARNAIDAAAQGGVVTFRLDRATSGRVRLAVRDTGPGLSPEVERQLFTPFFTTKERGQGIGLTLVGEILLSHGFEFALVDVGNGAEFTILF